VSIKNSSITGNAGRGLFIEATGAGTTTLLMESTVITGNLGNGIELDAVRMGIITADFGGGTLNSTGNNDISANLGTEITADLVCLLETTSLGQWGSNRYRWARCGQY